MAVMSALCGVSPVTVCRNTEDDTVAKDPGGIVEAVLYGHSCPC